MLEAGELRMKAKRIALASIAATLLFIVGPISMEPYEKATMEIGPLGRTCAWKEGS